MARITISTNPNRPHPLPFSRKRARGVFLDPNCQREPTMHSRRFAHFVSLSAFVAVTALAAAGSRAGDPPNQPTQASKANLALTAEVSVSSQQDGFSKANAIDGNRRSEWAANDSRPWIMLRWKEPVTVGASCFATGPLWGARPRAEKSSSAMHRRPARQDAGRGGHPRGGAVRGAIRAAEDQLVAVGPVQRAWSAPRLGGNRSLCRWQDDAQTRNGAPSRAGHAGDHCGG